MAVQGSAGQNHRLRNTLVVSGASLLAIALWIVCRLSTVRHSNWMPTFLGACQRIEESGIPPSPGDWWCGAPAWHQSANPLLFTLVAGVGFALPCALLAARGRRWTALLPLVAAPLAAGDTLVIWWRAEWSGSLLAATGGGLLDLLRFLGGILATLATLAAPAFAVMCVTPKRAWPSPPRRRSMWIATAICAAAAWAAGAISWHILAPTLRIFADEWWGGRWWWVAPTVAIGVFGALQGADRRWRPGGLSMSALFLSLGPAYVVINTFAWNPQGNWIIWTTFGGVLPLFIVGSICTGWPWIADRLDGQPARTREPAGSHIRVIGARALAIAVLASSLLLYAFDPFPASDSQPLPTYLGLRNQAYDVRARMNLDMAMKTMDAWHHEQGTYWGFDAKGAADLQPSLDWTNGAQTSLEPGVVAVVSPAPNEADGYEDVATVAVNSASGSSFCVQRTRAGPITYGKGTSMRGAIADCDSAPWSDSLMQRPALPTCVPRTGGFLICRMVQVLMWNILKTSKHDF